MITADDLLAARRRISERVNSALGPLFEGVGETRMRDLSPEQIEATQERHQQALDAQCSGLDITVAAVTEATTATYPDGSTEMLAAFSHGVVVGLEAAKAADDA